MRRDVTAALRLALQGQLSLRKTRLESFCVLVVGVLLSRTVNLSHLACMFPTRAEIASNYRRLQRFFEQVIVDGSQLARVIVRIAGVGSGPWLLALDRTCWKFGRYDINGLITGVGSRIFHHGMMARRAGERGERMFGVMGEVSVGRGGCRLSGLRLGRSGRRRSGGDDQAGMGEPPLGGSWAS